MFDWFKKVLSEANGEPSSIRVCLCLVVAAVIGCVVYVLVQHSMHNTLIDVPKNLSDLVSFTVGALSAAKAGSKFGESPATPSATPSATDNTPKPSAKAPDDPNL